MAGLIEKLDRLLAAHRPDYYIHLRPGATEAALVAFQKRFVLELPPSFCELYRWRDGQQPDYSMALHRNRMFLPLDDVVETKEMLDGMIGSDFEDPRHWRRGWVPFLHNGGGSYLCLDCAAEDGGVPGQLIAFWKADADRPVEYLSVAAWLDAVGETLDGNT